MGFGSHAITIGSGGAAGAGAGGSMVLMKAGQGTTTSVGTFVDIDTITFNASDFEDGDALLVYVNHHHTSGSGGTARLSLQDGTNTFNTTDVSMGGADAEPQHLQYLITGSPAYETNHNKAQVTCISIQSNDTLEAKHEPVTSMIDNWITTAWTLDLQAHGNAAGTESVRWWVYKIKST